eukprot:scaffold82151_cov40-Prasinocladus_malaysianus.AAC.1
MSFLGWKHASAAHHTSHISLDSSQPANEQPIKPTYEVRYLRRSKERLAEVALRKDVAFLKEQLHKVAGHVSDNIAAFAI